MIRFEIDPTLVREALLEGRKLIVEIPDPVHRPDIRRVIVGQPSPHRPKNKAA